MIVLSLDVSGAATGWAVGINGKIEAYGKFIGKTTNSKSKQFYDYSVWLEALLLARSPDIVIIERPFRGRNSNVLVQISKFIAIAEHTIYKTLGIEMRPEWMLDPKIVKKALKVKKGRDHDDNKKIMVKRINSIYGLHLKFVKNKAKSYNDDDISDAIALLHAWWLLGGSK